MKNYTIYVEEKLNRDQALQDRNLPDETCIHFVKLVAEELSEKYRKPSSTLYEDICEYIKRINEDEKISDCFTKKSGRLDEKKFYDYAGIGKNTWSNIRLGEGAISKESVLKLVIALHLNEEEARQLMKKASWSFNEADPRDRVILALLHIKCYDPQEAEILLDEYGRNENAPFKNIY